MHDDDSAIGLRQRMARSAASNTTMRPCDNV